MHRSLIRIGIGSFALFLGLAVGARDAHAAFDAFLKIDPGTGPAAASLKNCTGESKDSDHQGWTELKDFSFSVENPTTIGSATAGAGGSKTRFKEFSFTRGYDSLSGCITRALSTGAHVKVTLELRKAGGSKGAPYLTVEFDMAAFTSQTLSGNTGEEAPKETVSFAYGSAKWTYSQQKPDGTTNKMPPYGWSQVANKPIP
jgi:type VI secretion system secreted protein Hcp